MLCFNDTHGVVQAAVVFVAELAPQWVSACLVAFALLCGFDPDTNCAAELSCLPPLLITACDCGKQCGSASLQQHEQGLHHQLWRERLWPKHCECGKTCANPTEQTAHFRGKFHTAWLARLQRSFATASTAACTSRNSCCQAGLNYDFDATKGFEGEGPTVQVLACLICSHRFS